MAFTPIESSNQYVLMISENLSIVKFGESITKVFYLGPLFGTLLTADKWHIEEA